MALAAWMRTPDRTTHSRRTDSHPDAALLMIKTAGNNNNKSNTSGLVMKKHALADFSVAVMPAYREAVNVVLCVPTPH